MTENRYDYVLSHNHVDHITEEKAVKLIKCSPALQSIGMGDSLAVFEPPKPLTYTLYKDSLVVFLNQTESDVLNENCLKTTPNRLQSAETFQAGANILSQPPASRLQLDTHRSF